MNPNCEPNSPPDMVLLFETKAGWNQHGGPELFTFDNHDPRGGCPRKLVPVKTGILLNDGTVKLVRLRRIHKNRRRTPPVPLEIIAFYTFHLLEEQTKYPFVK
jgi:hypothetical protein